MMLTAKKYLKKVINIENPKKIPSTLDIDLTKNFVKHIYQLVFKRDADEKGLHYWSNELLNGLHPMNFLQMLFSSDELLTNQASNFFSQYQSTIQPTIKSEKNNGHIEDSLDKLNFIDLLDNWEKFEEIITKQQSENTSIQDTLKLLYLNKDRNEAFNRFRNSNEFFYIHHLLKILKVDTDQSICEIGGGAGYLAWALFVSGFQSMDLFEPNAAWTSGVGYLKTKADSKCMQIYHDLHEWHQKNIQYDVIVSKACLHHFGNISHISASIRQKMKIGGLWIAFREQFADTPLELITLLTEHDYCQKYKLYEWGYSASAYVDALEMVGLRLKAIVPAYYANDCIGTLFEDELSEEALAFTNEIDNLLQTSPEITVERFWQEHYARRTGRKTLLQYTRPQVMIFEKILI